MNAGPGAVGAINLGKQQLKERGRGRVIMILFLAFWQGKKQVSVADSGRF